MKYSQGSIGRVFLITFEDGEDLLSGLKEVALREAIKAATIMVLGGMRTAGVVCGPKEPVIPPEPIWTGFRDGREIVGFGTLFQKGEEPVIHLHGAIGRDRDTRVGCVRKDTSVYLTIEAVITEIVGTNAHKAPDEKTGLTLLKF